MSTYVSLDDFKDFVGVSHTEYDMLLENILNAAESHIEEDLGISYTDLLASGSYSDVPDEVKIAIQMLGSHWFNNREPYAIGVSVAEVPMTVERILNNHKYRRID